jgi:hypothetical protein
MKQGLRALRKPEGAHWQQASELPPVPRDEHRDILVTVHWQVRQPRPTSGLGNTLADSDTDALQWPGNELEVRVTELRAAIIMMTRMPVTVTVPVSFKFQV